MGTKFRSQVCSDSQANGPALLCYAMIISVQKLTQVIKTNTAGFLRIQRQENTKENTKKTTEINWDW